MAPTAFIELGLAVDLFEKGALQSPRARNGLVSIYTTKIRNDANLLLDHPCQAEKQGDPGLFSVSHRKSSP
jgi:hypothetical protein